MKLTAMRWPLELAVRWLAPNMVLEDATMQRGMVITDRTVRDVLANQIQQGFQKSGRDGFADFLGRTDEDARRYYEENKSKLAQPETRQIRNIVVAAEAEAREVGERARAGADFTSLVKQYSLDASTRESGGDIGFVAREQLDGPYADAAFAAQPGTVFGPVKAGSGWNVGEVVQIRPTGQPPFEQIQDQLRAEIPRMRALAKWNAWVEQRVQSANIQYADEYRPSGSSPRTSPAPGSPLPEPAGRPQ